MTCSCFACQSQPPHSCLKVLPPSHSLSLSQLSDTDGWSLLMKFHIGECSACSSSSEPKIFSPSDARSTEKDSSKPTTYHDGMDNSLGFWSVWPPVAPCTSTNNHHVRSRNPARTKRNSCRSKRFLSSTSTNNYHSETYNYDGIILKLVFYKTSFMKKVI